MKAKMILAKMILAKVILLAIMVLPVFVYAKYISVKSDYLLVAVNDDNGRFLIASLEGDPGIRTDNNKMLLDRSNPYSTVTFLNIDGFITTFGSVDGNFSQRAVAKGNMIITEWKIKGYDIVQVVQLVRGNYSGRRDTVRLSYMIYNFSGNAGKVGMQMIFDTYLGKQDWVSYILPDGRSVEKEVIFSGDDVPDYWYAYDDIEKPTMKMQGTLSHKDIVKPDKLAFGEWENLFDYQWDFEPSKREYRNISRADTAVAMTYSSRDIKDGDSAFFSTMYGIYGAAITSYKDVVISTTTPYFVRKLPFRLTLEVLNKSKKVLSDPRIRMILPKDFLISKYYGDASKKELKPNELIKIQFEISNKEPVIHKKYVNVYIYFEGEDRSLPVSVVIKRTITIDVNRGVVEDIVKEFYDNVGEEKKAIVKKTGSTKKDNVDITKVYEDAERVITNKYIATTIEETNTNIIVEVVPTNTNIIVEVVPTNTNIIVEVVPTNTNIIVEVVPTNTNIIIEVTPTNTNIIVEVKPTNITITNLLTTSKKEIDGYYHLGVAYYSMKKYHKAFRNFNHVIENKPTYKDTYFRRGNSFLKLHIYDYAIYDFKKALELNPKLVEAYINIGNAYFHKKDHDEAILYYSSAIAINEKLLYAYYNKGLVYLRQKEYVLAIDEFNRTIELNEKFQAGIKQRNRAFALKQKIEVQPEE